MRTNTDGHAIRKTQPGLRFYLCFFYLFLSYFEPSELMSS